MQWLFVERIEYYFDLLSEKQLLLFWVLTTGGRMMMDGLSLGLGSPFIWLACFTTPKFWGPCLTSYVFSKCWLTTCSGAGIVPDVKMKTVNVTLVFLKELTVQNGTQKNKGIITWSRQTMAHRLNLALCLIIHVKFYWNTSTPTHWCGSFQQQQSKVVETETVWPPKPTSLIIGIFKEKYCWPLL